MAAGEPGLTHWSRFDVAGMWSLIRGVSTDDAFRQAGAWQSTYEAAQSLAGRLRWYRDGLAGKWSPDGSEAAAAYLGRLDELIGSAQQLADVAVSNRQALVTLANAVDEARPKMQRVYEESQAMRQVGAQPRAGAALALRQQQLQNQATQIMKSLGSAALDSWRHYATADDYQPPQPAIGIDRPIKEPTQAAQQTFEPTGRVDRRDSGIDSSLAPGSGHPGGQVSDSPPPLPRTFQETSKVPTLTASSSPSEISSSSMLTLPSATSINDSAPEVVGKSVALRAGHESDADYSRFEEAVTPRRLNASSKGVIGGDRIGSPSRPAIGSSRSVNHVGGVVGGERSGVGVMPSGTSVRGHQAERYRRREYDLEDPWFVAGGVSPVLKPAPEPTRFDPGPGVIGIDR